MEFAEREAQRTYISNLAERRMASFHQAIVHIKMRKRKEPRALLNVLLSKGVSSFRSCLQAESPCFHQYQFHGVAGSL